MKPTEPTAPMCACHCALQAFSGSEAFVEKQLTASQEHPITVTDDDRYFEDSDVE
jgi:hypothetical protein